MISKVIRITAAEGTIRGFFADTTALVDKASKIHFTSPVASSALGRTLTVTSMMGLMLKEEHHKITVKINGGGDMGTILVTGDSEGNVKGYVDNPQVESTHIRPGKLNVGEAVGKNGSITIIKDIGLKEPYIGNYPLVSGEIGDDVAAYYLYSEQQPSAVALGVLINVDHSIKAAGGFIIQVLPGISQEYLDKLEDKLGQIQSITELMDKGLTIEEIIDHVLGELQPKLLYTYPVDFICDCNEDRLERALISIGEKDLREIIEEDHGAEMICHFCNKKYFFNEEKLEELVKQAKR